MLVDALPVASPRPIHLLTTPATETSHAPRVLSFLPFPLLHVIIFLKPLAIPYHAGERLLALFRSILRLGYWEFCFGLALLSFEQTQPTDLFFPF